MARLGFLDANAKPLPTHAAATFTRRFQRVADMLAYQNVFLAETLEAEARMRTGPPPLLGGGVG